MLRGTDKAEELLPDRWKAAHPQAVREYRAQERRDKADTAVWLFPYASRLKSQACSWLIGFSPEGGTRTAGVRKPPDLGALPTPQPLIYTNIR